MKIALVVPTIREHSFRDFLQSWTAQDHWDLSMWVVVEDNPQRSFQIPEPITHVSWAEIEEDLGPNAWVISRRDSAIRSYGFLRACRLGADVVVTLDDDCLPYGPGFCQTHLDNLISTPRWCSSIPGARTRGLPYDQLGECKDVAFSVGLWKLNPDYDAIQTLTGASPNLTLPPTRIMPSGQYWPFCGMNFAFPRSSLAMCCFAPMGDGQPFHRFDDIWFGVVAQKVCRHLRLFITCGEPYIRHVRASNPFVNLEREAPGIRWNEIFWQVIDAIDLGKADTVNQCMGLIGCQLEQLGPGGWAKQLGMDEKFCCYLNHYGKVIQTWLSLVSQSRE